MACSLDENLGLESVSLLVHSGELYIRHSKVEQGFLPVNTQTMRIENDKKSVKLDEDEDKDNETRKRFCWTTEDNAIRKGNCKRKM